MNEAPLTGKARRRADQALIAAYHEAKLAELLDHVREAFGEYDAGRLDAFELDKVIHQYHRAAQELWKFCVVSGTQLALAAGTLEWWRTEGEEPDWWEVAAPSRK
jgi:hypothetical protein